MLNGFVRWTEFTLKRGVAFCLPLFILVLFTAASCGDHTGQTQASTETGTASSDTIVYITRTGTKYHESNCRFLQKSKTAISINEAIRQGYEPCKVCEPPEE